MKKQSVMFAVPAIMVYTLFMVVPMIIVFASSFTNWDGIQSGFRFTGLENYVRMASDSRFLGSVKNTLQMGIVIFLFVNIVGLGLALLLTRGLRLTNFYRSVFFLPTVLSSVAVTFAFSSLFSYTGIINNFLINISLEGQIRDWLGVRSNATFSIELVEIWRTTGYYMIIYIAALQTVPQELYEAADIDGDGEWKKLHINDIADCFIMTAQRYNHSAIFVSPIPGNFDAQAAVLERIREKTGDEYFLLMHGDPTWAIPNGETMMEFSTAMYSEPEKLNEVSKRRLEESLEFAQRMKQKSDNLLDGFGLCSDYCFNADPFFSPELFDELIAPYLKAVVDGYREMGYYSIKHTDGNIMPIIENVIACGPDALHSLDPQGGVDLNEVVDKYSDKICLVGNVNCALLQTGSAEECDADIRRSLREEMRAPGFIFSTSNCVYTGMPLDRYERLHTIWQEEGIRKTCPLNAPTIYSARRISSNATI